MLGLGDDGVSGKGGSCDGSSIKGDCGAGGGVGVADAAGDKAFEGGDNDVGSHCECAGGKGRSDSCCGCDTGQLGNGDNDCGNALGCWVRANGVIKGLVSAERVCGCDSLGCCWLWRWGVYKL